MDNALRLSHTDTGLHPHGGHVCSNCVCLKMTNTRTIPSSSAGPIGVLLFSSDLADTVVPVPRTNSSRFQPISFSANTPAQFSADCPHIEGATLWNTGPLEYMLELNLHWQCSNPKHLRNFDSQFTQSSCLYSCVIKMTAGQWHSLTMIFLIRIQI